MGFFDRFKKKSPPAPEPTSSPIQVIGGDEWVFDAPFYQHVPGVSYTPSAKRSVRLERGKAPAVDHGVVLAKGGITLAKKYEGAGISLAKANLNGVRAEAVMLLDHSGSMRRDYQNGTVQNIVDRALGFALQIDGDGKIPVISFDSKVYRPVEVTLANYGDIVNKSLYRPDRMGRTNLTDALAAVLEMAKETDAPLYVIIVTDGEPDDEAGVEELCRQLSEYPVFLKFLAIKYVKFLDDLDNNLRNRLVDNANAQFLGNLGDLRRIDDVEFADKMVTEWDTWTRDALAANVLLPLPN